MVSCTLKYFKSIKSHVKCSPHTQDTTKNKTHPHPHTYTQIFEGDANI